VFLVDGEGVIRRAWRYESSDVPDVDELLDACRELGSETAGSPPGAHPS
jgi:hypothetical protein